MSILDYDYPDLMNSPDVIPQIVTAFQTHLQTKHGNQHRKDFYDRLNNNQDAAMSEAVVFNWLWGKGLNPRVSQNLGVGGPDFACTYQNQDFVVEVTCLGKEEFTKATGAHMLSGQHMIYRPPTQMIRARISDKAAQFSNTSCATLLIITSFHPGYLFLGAEEAVDVLVSDSGLTFPIGNPSEREWATDLKKSIFFRANKYNPRILEYCRQSVSALLLMLIQPDRIGVVGILHPKPRFSFDHTISPEIPFLIVSNDVIAERQIMTNWLNSDPNDPKLAFSPIVKNLDL